MRRWLWLFAILLVASGVVVLIDYHHLQWNRQRLERSRQESGFELVKLGMTRSEVADIMGEAENVFFVDSDNRVEGLQRVGPTKYREIMFVFILGPDGTVIEKFAQ
jgi:hypothetical protein